MFRFFIFQLRRFPRAHRAALGFRQGCVSCFWGSLKWIRRLPPPWSLGLARGMYSDYELLQAVPRAHEGRVILTDQGSPPAAPDSVMVLANKNQHMFQPWPVFWIRHREVELIGPSLAHLNDKGFISQEATYCRSLNGLRIQDAPAYHYFRGPRARAPRLEGNWTSIISRWMRTDMTQPYGHWIKDVLPRLAVLPELPPDTRILIPAAKQPFQAESLEMLGLLDRCRPTSERHLVIENYYFSSPPSMIACYSPYVVDWLRKTFLPRMEPPDPSLPKRIYLRRRGNIRNVVDEPRLLDFFQGLGWAIVDPIDLSFPDQMRLFSQAEAICGPHGSAFSNLIWSTAKCKVLEIFCDAYICANAEWISGCLPQTQHRYLIFPKDHRLNAIVDLDVVKKALADYDLL
jgi:capsular polysaccharide biosynthesis protein